MFEVKNVKRKVQKFKFGNSAPKFVLRVTWGRRWGVCAARGLGTPLMCRGSSTHTGAISGGNASFRTSSWSVERRA